MSNHDEKAQAALDYHAQFPPGKISINSSKPVTNQEELSLTYTPGVAAPCLEIAKTPQDVYKYTNKGNTVAIVSDGTAVLGLGNIGPEAAIPVMEGKAILFKMFADIDAIPLCLRFEETENKMDKFLTAVKTLIPSLAGVNLEDIAAPFCFDLHDELDQNTEIPIFHDDQDGTAVIILAGVMNALKVVGKDIAKIKIVMSGAGAAGIACAKLLHKCGAPKENIFVCDSRGLVTTSRQNLNRFKSQFAKEAPDADLAHTIREADLFIGVSVAGVVNAEMVRSMAKDAIIFAVANPIPEIMPDIALAAGARIVGTGRSDFKNQVNNSLGFPGLFRGALDTQATHINQEMQLAASAALAVLVHKKPEGRILKILLNAYPEEAEVFSREDALAEDCVIPKQFDLRVVPAVARAVAKAAMDSGVARLPIQDLEAYENQVLERVIKHWG